MGTCESISAIWVMMRVEGERRNMVEREVTGKVSIWLGFNRKGGRTRGF